MAKQIINTDRLILSATKLRAVNNSINSAFDTLQTKAKQIDNNWRGAAGDAAKSTMYQLFKYSEARSTVIQNYVNMLEQQVSPGYNNTETVNTKLADQFK